MYVLCDNRQCIAAVTPGGTSWDVLPVEPCRRQSRLPTFFLSVYFFLFFSLVSQTINVANADNTDTRAWHDNARPDGWMGDILRQSLWSAYILLRIARDIDEIASPPMRTQSGAHLVHSWASAELPRREYSPNDFLIATVFRLCGYFCNCDLVGESLIINANLAASYVGKHQTRSQRKVPYRTEALSVQFSITMLFLPFFSLSVLLVFLFKECIAIAFLYFSLCHQLRVPFIIHSFILLKFLFIYLLFMHCHSRCHRGFLASLSEGVILLLLLYCYPLSASTYSNKQNECNDTVENALTHTNGMKCQTVA